MIQEQMEKEKGGTIMKRTLLAVLAAVLICLSFAALAENATLTKAPDGFPEKPFTLYLTVIRAPKRTPSAKSSQRSLKSTRASRWN